MPDKNPSVMELLINAFEESKGETVDLIVDHGVLRGVTPEMFRWWGVNINDSNRYRMWYPEDHISFKWEVPPRGGKRIESIVNAEEKIGEFPASVLRIQHTEPDSFPIPPTYKNFNGGGNILGPDDKPVAWLCHEFEETPDGISLRSTFRFPSKTPEKFLEAMHKHCKGEMGHLTEFLPKLYSQNVT